MVFLSNDPNMFGTRDGGGGGDMNCDRLLRSPSAFVPVLHHDVVVTGLHSQFGVQLRSLYDIGQLVWDRINPYCSHAFRACRRTATGNKMDGGLHRNASSL